MLLGNIIYKLELGKLGNNGSRILDSRVNPLQPILWILRQNEKDIINLYNLLTPFIQLVTKSNMLNFGYWTENTKHPVQAQEELCTLVGKFAELHSAKIALEPYLDMMQ